MKASTPISLAPLRAFWERQARRIDALTLRERAILFLSLVAVLAALFDTLVLTPQTARAKQRSDARIQQEAELAQLRELFVTTSRNTSDPAQALRTQLEAASAERAQLDEQLHKNGSAGAGQDLAVLLQRLLARQPGLVLERLTLLPDAPVAAAQPGASAPAALAGISWQGVELQLQGGYAELQRDMQGLERELPGLRWGEMQLSSSGSAEAPRLRVQVFLLKVQP